MMLSAGLNQQQALDATHAYRQAGETANLLATVCTNMGDKTREAGAEIGRLGDILTRTQRHRVHRTLARPAGRLAHRAGDPSSTPGSSWPWPGPLDGVTLAAGRILDELGVEPAAPEGPAPP